jgi:hypothetical protein
MAPISHPLSYQKNLDFTRAAVYAFNHLPVLVFLTALCWIRNYFLQLVITDKPGRLLAGSEQSVSEDKILLFLLDTLPAGDGHLF